MRIWVFLLVGQNSNLDIFKMSKIAYLEPL